MAHVAQIGPLETQLQATVNKIPASTWYAELGIHRCGLQALVARTVAIYGLVPSGGAPDGRALLMTGASALAVGDVMLIAGEVVTTAFRSGHPIEAADQSAHANRLTR